MYISCQDQMAIYILFNNSSEIRNPGQAFLRNYCIFFALTSLPKGCSHHRRDMPHGPSFCFSIVIVTPGFTKKVNHTNIQLLQTESHLFFYKCVAGILSRTELHKPPCSDEDIKIKNWFLWLNAELTFRRRGEKRRSQAYNWCKLTNTLFNYPLSNHPPTPLPTTLS